MYVCKTERLFSLVISVFVDLWPCLFTSKTVRLICSSDFTLKKR